MKNCFLKYFSLFQEPWVPRFWHNNCYKLGSETTPTRKQFVSPRCPKQLSKWGSHMVPKSIKWHFRPPHVLPAALMVSQGASECPEWYPGLPKCRHQASQITVWCTKHDYQFLFRNKKCFENQHPETSEPAHIPAERFNKTHAQQQHSESSNRS